MSMRIWAIKNGKPGGGTGTGQVHVPYTGGCIEWPWKDNLGYFQKTRRIVYGAMDIL